MGTVPTVSSQSHQSVPEVLWVDAHRKEGHSAIPYLPTCILCHSLEEKQHLFQDSFSCTDLTKEVWEQKAEKSFLG